MKFSYDAETDSLYIELSANAGAEAEEVAPGIVVDYDASGHIVGLDIEDASKNISLSNVDFSGFSPKIGEIHP
jgi:uncharacterized protein YuzE